MHYSATGAELDLDGALLKAHVKARLLGTAERVQLGRFQILRRCGQGGEGVVYAAFDPLLGGDVALKCLHRAHAAGGASLRNEFRALSDIVHPNLALLYELFCVDEQWFYTMELLSGLDFVAHVRQQGAERQVELRRAFVQLLRGLSAIHAAGKIHRDLKPGNVLVEPNGRVVILDYGLMIDRPDPLHVQPATVPAAGTVAYMAPEQAAGRGVTSAADLYAAGAMLFESLAGQRVSASQSVSRGHGTAPLRPSQFARDVDPDLDALCADLLTADPLRRPTTHQALARLGGPAPIESSASYPSAEAAEPKIFVGRAAELRELHAAFARSLAGEASVVLLHGESGIGKSALLSHFCAQLAGDPRVLLLQGCCYERENAAYKVFEAAAEGLADHLGAAREPAAAPAPQELLALARIFPAFSRLQGARAAAHAPRPTQDRGDLQKAAFAAARELFARVCAERAVVLCVDDLQWGDLDSMRLLQHIVARPHPPPILIVGAYRRDESDSSPFLREALSERGLRAGHLSFGEIALEPLSPGDAAELVQRHRRADSAPPAQLEACVDAARGLPFALVELARLGARDALETATAADLDHVVRRRMAGCSTAAHGLLEVLCIAARPLEVSLALAAARLSTDMLPAASELCAARLARWRETGADRCLEAYHALVRETVCRRLETERVRMVHTELARHMRRLGIDQPGALVTHLVASGERERGGLAAIAAAERAAEKLAWNSAADLLRQALGLLPEAQAQAHRLHEQLAEMSSFAGRHAEAARAYLRRAQGEPAGTAAQLERLAAQQLMRAGESAAAIALLRKLLAEVDLHYPDNQWKAGATYWLGRARMRIAPQPRPRGPRSARSEARAATLAALYAELWLQDPARACVVHNWFYREASRARDRYWVQALAWEIMHITLGYGQSAQARVLPLLLELDAASAASGAPYDLAIAQCTRATVLIHCLSRPLDALPLLRSAEQLFSERCPGTHFERCWLALLLDFVLEFTGNFTQLIESVHRREREGSERNDGYSMRQLLASMPVALLLQDRPEAALAFMRKHWQRSDVPFMLFDLIGIMGTSNALAYGGDARGAHAVLAREWTRLWRSGAFVSRVLRETAVYFAARNAVLLYWQTRDPRLRRQARALSARPERMRPIMQPLLRMVAASLARADGEHARCQELLELAARDYARIHQEPGLWSARYRLAQLRGDRAAQAAARSWMLERGARDPDKWIALGCPGPRDW